MPPEIPIDRPITEDELEDAMIYAFLNPGGQSPQMSSPNEMLTRLQLDHAARNAVLEANGGSEELERRFIATIWRWVTSGLILPWNTTFTLAPGSRELIESRADEAEIVLHRSGLVRRLRDRCPNLDPVTERYAAFAQESFLVGHYQATAVMIGVASEAALLFFVPRCEAALKELSLATPKRKNDQAGELVRWIDSTVTQHRKALSQAVHGAGEGGWIGELPALLGGVATGIRLTRNEAGHPTAHSVSRDECRNMLGLFPRLAEALFVSARALDEIAKP